MAGNVNLPIVFGVLPTGNTPASDLDNDFNVLATAANSTLTVTNFYTDTGFINTPTVNITLPQIWSQQQGQQLAVLIAFTNNGPVNITVNGSVTNVQNLDASQLVGGQIVAGGVAILQWTSPNIAQLLNPVQASGGSGAFTGIIVTPPANQYAIQVANGSNPNGQSYGEIISAGTNASDVNFALQSQNGTVGFLQVRGDGYIKMGAAGPGAFYNLIINSVPGMQTVAGADISARGIQICRYVLVQEAKVNATQANSAYLTIAIPVAGTYGFRVVATMDGNGGGVAFGMNYSGTYTVLQSYSVFGGNNNASNIAVTAQVLAAPGQQASVGATGSYIGVVIDGHLTVSTAGTLAFNWAQQVTNATPSNLHAGSFMTVMQVS
jgi:hypothetical protein